MTDVNKTNCHFDCTVFTYTWCVRKIKFSPKGFFSYRDCSKSLNHKYSVHNSFFGYLTVLSIFVKTKKPYEILLPICSNSHFSIMQSHKANWENRLHLHIFWNRRRIHKPNHNLHTICRRFTVETQQLSGRVCSTDLNRPDLTGLNQPVSSSIFH